MSNSLRPHGLHYIRLPCPSSSPGACSNSRPSSRWCYPTISSSVVHFSSSLQSFPASGSFPKSQFFPSSGQNIGDSASVSVLPMSIQDWFPLELSGWISLQSRNSQESSPTPQFKSINSLALSFLYGPTLTYISQYKPLLLIFYVCFGVYVCSITQSCPSFVDPMDYSPPGSSVHGISQARTPE